MSNDLLEIEVSLPAPLSVPDWGCTANPIVHVSYVPHSKRARPVFVDRTEAVTGSSGRVTFSKRLLLSLSSLTAAHGPGDYVFAVFDAVCPRLRPLADVAPADKLATASCSPDVLAKAAAASGEHTVSLGLVSATGAGAGQIVLKPHAVAEPSGCGGSREGWVLTGVGMKGSAAAAAADGGGDVGLRVVLTAPGSSGSEAGDELWSCEIPLAVAADSAAYSTRLLPLPLPAILRQSAHLTLTLTSSKGSSSLASVDSRSLVGKDGSAHEAKALNGQVLLLSTVVPAVDEGTWGLPLAGSVEWARRSAWITAAAAASAAVAEQSDSAETAVQLQMRSAFRLLPSSSSPAPALSPALAASRPGAWRGCLWAAWAGAEAGATGASPLSGGARWAAAIPSVVSTANSEVPALTLPSLAAAAAAAASATDPNVLLTPSQAAAAGGDLTSLAPVPLLVGTLIAGTDTLNGLVGAPPQRGEMGEFTDVRVTAVALARVLDLAGPRSDALATLPPSAAAKSLREACSNAARALDLARARLRSLARVEASVLGALGTRDSDALAAAAAEAAVEGMQGAAVLVRAQRALAGAVATEARAKGAAETEAAAVRAAKAEQKRHKREAARAKIAAQAVADAAAGKGVGAARVSGNTAGRVAGLVVAIVACALLYSAAQLMRPHVPSAAAAVVSSLTSTHSFSSALASLASLSSSAAGSALESPLLLPVLAVSALLPALMRALLATTVGKGLPLAAPAASTAAKCGNLLYALCAAPGYACLLAAPAAQAARLGLQGPLADAVTLLPVEVLAAVVALAAAAGVLALPCGAGPASTDSISGSVSGSGAGSSSGRGRRGGDPAAHAVGVLTLGAALVAAVAVGALAWWQKGVAGPLLGALAGATVWACNDRGDTMFDAAAVVALVAGVLLGEVVLVEWAAAGAALPSLWA